VSVRKAESPSLFHTDRKGCHRLAAMTPTDEEVFWYFVEPTQQGHSREQHSVGVDLGALRRKPAESGHPHHAVNLVAVVTSPQKNLAEPCQWIILIRLHRLNVVLDKGSVFIDFFGPCVRQHTSGIVPDDLDTPPQKIRL
jgi:hypothetical protein